MWNMKMNEPLEVRKKGNERDNEDEGKRSINLDDRQDSDYVGSDTEKGELKVASPRYMTEDGVRRHESGKPRDEPIELRGVPRDELTEQRGEPIELGIEKDENHQAIFLKYTEPDNLDSWDSNDHDEHGATFDIFKEETDMTNDSTYARTEAAQVGGVVRKDYILGTRRTIVERNHASRGITGRTVAVGRDEHVARRGGFALEKAGSTIRRALASDGRARSIVERIGSASIGRDIRTNSTSAATESGNRTDSLSFATIGRTGSAAARRTRRATSAATKDDLAARRVKSTSMRGASSSTRDASSSSVNASSAAGRATVRDGRDRFMPSRRADSTYARTEAAQVGGVVRKDYILGTRRTIVERNHASRGITGRTVAVGRDEHVARRGGFALEKAGSTIRRALASDGRARSIVERIGSASIGRDIRTNSTSAATESGNRTDSLSFATIGRTGSAAARRTRRATSAATKDDLAARRVKSTSMRGASSSTRDASSSSVNASSAAGRATVRDGRDRFMPSRRADMAGDAAMDGVGHAEGMEDDALYGDNVTEGGYDGVPEGGFDPQTFGNGPMMPWIYQQMFQAAQKPKESPGPSVRQPTRKRKIYRGHKPVEATQEPKEPSAPAAG
ncbi:hypothetical protein COCNU_scaffold007514G000070 [Cocos nucifera]|nr:hypothetical protein [Cocos nucifera]